MTSVTAPEPTVEPGVILETVLKTLFPVDVFPPVAPVIVSVIEFPAMSVPTTVKTVLD